MKPRKSKALGVKAVRGDAHKQITLQRSSEFRVTLIVKLSLVSVHTILVELYSIGMSTKVRDLMIPRTSEVTLLRLKSSSSDPFTTHQTDNTSPSCAHIRSGLNV